MDASVLVPPVAEKTATQEMDSLMMDTDMAEADEDGAADRACDEYLVATEVLPAKHIPPACLPYSRPPARYRTTRPTSPRWSNRSTRSHPSGSSAPRRCYSSPCLPSFTFASRSPYPAHPPTFFFILRVGACRDYRG